MNYYIVRYNTYSHKDPNTQVHKQTFVSTKLRSEKNIRGQPAVTWNPF